MKFLYIDYNVVQLLPCRGMLPSSYYLYIFSFCLGRHKKYLVIGYENRCYLANLLSSKGLKRIKIL